jgi:hypothetical protein
MKPVVEVSGIDFGVNPGTMTGALQNLILLHDVLPRRDADEVALPARP